MDRKTRKLRGYKLGVVAFICVFFFGCDFVVYHHFRVNDSANKRFWNIELSTTSSIQSSVAVAWQWKEETCKENDDCSRDDGDADADSDDGDNGGSGNRKVHLYRSVLRLST